MSGEIFVVYARAANGAIGKEGRLPWHIPADLARFKRLTMGKPMIMGRKTFDSLPGLLPGRRHIVLSHQPGWEGEGAQKVDSVEQALAIAGAGPVAIIGGAAVFEAFLPRAARAEVTHIHADYPGDVFLPKLGPEWVEEQREDHEAQGDRPAFSFVTYRKDAP